ncbi:hypothetical protein BDU57DRAFT_451285 [Ampelomyces quisqualis]|uniref:DUF7730 domain-containing protein n=1 Tax=Ampelomyces quisqualis TaxID=50730 RepID=A0A6A5QHS6_AMPQU|nr:hypothetical protein BDU57DRAFT_451285 [Ampelomyces quisqualis]
MPLSNREESSLEAGGHSKATQLLRRTDPGAPTFSTSTPPSNEQSLVRDVSAVENGSFEIPRVRSLTPELPKFRKFMALPLELRERIYELALYTGQAIHPHLCGRKANGAIKFHDDNQHSRQYPNHNAINKLLGVTYVSKKVHDESLPCFYSANTFSVGADTATYFAHLERMDRFHMIRHVSFSIPLRDGKWTAQSLEQLTTYLKNVEIYERDHPLTEPYLITPTSREHGMVCGAEVYTNLVQHPRHLAGGLNDMALFICLDMLSSAFNSSSNSEKYTSSIVLPVPSASEFTSYPRLQWFSYVLHGLGIHLHFVEGYELAYNQKAVIGIVWHQKFQKKDFKQVSKKEDAGNVTKRVKDMFPDMELAERKVCNSCSYMRTSCDGNRYTWFTVKH